MNGYCDICKEIIVPYELYEPNKPIIFHEINIVNYGWSSGNEELEICEKYYKEKYEKE